MKYIFDKWYNINQYYYLIWIILYSLVTTTYTIPQYNQVV